MATVADFEGEWDDLPDHKLLDLYAGLDEFLGEVMDDPDEVATVAEARVELAAMEIEIERRAVLFGKTGYRG